MKREDRGGAADAGRDDTLSQRVMGVAESHLLRNTIHTLTKGRVPYDVRKETLCRMRMEEKLPKEILKLVRGIGGPVLFGFYQGSFHQG